MEIERKYLIRHLPAHLRLDSFSCRIIEQGYLNTTPVIRIRKDNDKYELTYKSSGLYDQGRIQSSAYRKSISSSVAED